MLLAINASFRAARKAKRDRAAVADFELTLEGSLLTLGKELRQQARLSRNVASRQGRIDFIRVHLRLEQGRLWADPVLGKSGLISTMVKADGLIEIDINTEGLDKGAEVEVIPM